MEKAAEISRSGGAGNKKKNKAGREVKNYQVHYTSYDIEYCVLHECFSFLFKNRAGSAIQVIIYSRVWINRVRLPILLMVSWTRKMNISLSPFARIRSRETGSAVPSRVSLLILYTQAESGAYSGDSSRFLRRRRLFLYLNHHTPSVQLLFVVVFFTLTDRASSIPSNIRGCQFGTWSAGQKEIRGTSTKLQ